MRCGWRCASAAAPVDPERRLLFKRTLGAAAATVAAGLGALAIRDGTRGPKRPRGRDHARQAAARARRLHASCSSPTCTSARRSVATSSRSWCARTNALDARRRRHHRRPRRRHASPSCATQVAPLAELRAKHGVYFVTGNHEYYSGVDEWLAELTTLGVRVLRNERVAIGRRASTWPASTITERPQRRRPRRRPAARARRPRPRRARSCCWRISRAGQRRGRRTASASSSPATPTAARSGPGTSPSICSSRTSPGWPGTRTRRSTSAAAPATGARRCASARRRRSRASRLRATGLRG